MAKSRTAVLPRLGLAILVSALCGLLVAALALPVVGGAGLVARSAADDFIGLPAELEAPVAATRSRVLAADGSLLATFYRVNRVTVPLSSVPELTQKALIAIEDSRFYEHNGVDYKGTVRAALTNARSGRVEQGGSTLTQQYVKNALIEKATDKAGQQAANEDSLDRKLREARYALALERKIGKDRVLENYFNIAYYGNGVYGIGTAASYYFRKPVAKLTLAQGALLAGMVQNPTRFAPTVKNKKAVRDRRNTVLGRMADLGYISQSARAKAAATSVTTKVSPVGSGCETASRAPFFCDYVRHELLDTPVGAALGSDRDDRQRALLTGGLTIRTSLDRTVQKAAQKAVDRRVPAGDSSRAAAVADVVEPGTGAVKAMAVDRRFGDGKNETKLNLATGGTSGFQAGSTFKAFVLAQALAQGIPLSLSMNAPQSYCSRPLNYTLPGGKCPGNAGDSESGYFDLRQATHLSVNTYFIKLEERTGVSKPADIAEKLGLRRVRDTNGKANQPLLRVPSFVLGTNEVSPLAMAGAYAAFAAHGTFCEPRAVTSIDAADGTAVAVPKPACGQALEPAVADRVTDVLRGVIDGPERARTGASASIGRPAAGKTGTTNGSQAAWFVGYTPQLATAVWVGRTTPSPLRNVRINGRYYRELFGGTVPAAIWRDTMRGALSDVPARQFTHRSTPVAGSPDAQEPTPDASASPGDEAGETPMGDVVVPDVRGLSFAAARATLETAGFVVRRGGFLPAAPVPFGNVASTSPAGGRPGQPGDAVTVLLSNGQQQPPVNGAPTPTPSASGR